MKLQRAALLTVASLVLLAGIGCAHPAYYPPPPPPPVAGVPPIIQLAERNGFETGRSDGARDAAQGFPFSARRTRAYHQTPGYDPHWARSVLIKTPSATPTCAGMTTASTVASVSAASAGMGLAAPSPGEYRCTMTELRPFHIAFPVDDLEAARHFYGTVLGCPEGRSADHWIDFNLFGHQIVAHLKPGHVSAKAHSNPVDGHDVPIPHFGRRP